MLVPGDKVAVLGAGNMGSGIAQSLADSGYRVVVRDLTDKELQRGSSIVEENLSRSLKRGKITEEKKAKVLSHIEWTTDLAKAADGAKLIIEAVFEEEKVKLGLFADLARSVQEKTIVVTNTSSLSVTTLFRAFPHPERTAGLHFFFPASVNKLVEIIASPDSSKETLQALTSLVFSLKKIPITTLDKAGFCVNRFFVPLLNEAARMVEEGVAGIPDVEAAANELLGTKMGPFALMNATGVPIAYHATSSLGRAFGPFYAPSALLKQQFEKGEKWKVDGVADPAKMEAVKGRILGLVCGIASQLVAEGITSAEETDRGAVTGLAWRQGPFALMNSLGVANVLEHVETLHLRWAQGFPVSTRLSEVGITGEAWPLSTVKLEKEGPLAWVLIDRPEVMNAINSSLLDDLDRVIVEASSDPQVRVILLGSTSNVFAAGADISEMVAKTVSDAAAFTAKGHQMLHRIQTLGVPTIAVVDGYAFGGGLEIALSADFILASESAKLGLPEVSLGIIPGFGGTQRLPRRVGAATAKMMILAGLQVTAREAYEMGLVARLFPQDRLKEEARALALLMASRAPIAVRLAKKAIEVGMDGPLEAGLTLEQQLATYTFTTDDLREGMRAFLEKRPPGFKNR